MEKLKDIYRKMYQAMILKDIRVLENLLDESFLLVHITGMRQSKRDYLKAIENGTLNYYSCEETSFNVLEKDSIAHVIGKSKVNASVFGGNRHTWPLKLDIDLVKKNNNWKITKIVASTY